MTKALLFTVFVTMLSACSGQEQHKKAINDLVSLCHGGVSVEMRLGAYQIQDTVIVRCENFNPTTKGAP